MVDYAMLGFASRAHVDHVTRAKTNIRISPTSPSSIDGWHSYSGFRAMTLPSSAQKSQKQEQLSKCWV